MSTPAPRVSVLLPVYRAENTVRRAAESILLGHWRDLELIAVVDGSDDASGAVLEALARTEPRLRVLHTAHGGVAAAANRAFEASRAPLIARMDADDEALPDRLARQVHALEHGCADVVGSRVAIVDATGAAVTAMRRYQRWLNALLTPEAIAAARFVELPLVNPSLTGRRAAFALGYRQWDDTAAAMPEDYDWFLRAVARGFRFAKVDDVLLRWTESADRLTRRHPDYTTAAFDRCRRAHLRAGPLRAIARVDLWGVARTGKPWLRWLQQEGIHVREAYDIDPRRVGQRVHGQQVRHCDTLGDADGTPILVAVGADGARAQIDAALRQRGYRPGVDAWFVA